MDFLEHLSINYSPEIVEKIVNSFSKERTHSFVLNNAKYSEEHLFDINIIKKHPFIDNAFYFENQKLGNDFRFKNGVIYIQDAAAMMPVHLLGVEQNDIILDMCASPGGKTIDAAIKLNNTGMIISNELSYERSKVLSSNVEKLGFSNVFVTNNDLSKISVDGPGFINITLSDNFIAGLMDKIGEDSRLGYAKVENPQNIVIDSGGPNVAKSMHVPKLFVHPVGLLARIFGGFDYSYSTKTSLAKTNIPVIFVHGLADDFVPSNMTEQNYAACNSNKTIVLVENATHGYSFLVDEKGVKRALECFIAETSK